MLRIFSNPISLIAMVDKPKGANDMGGENLSELELFVGEIRKKIEMIRAQERSSAQRVFSTADDAYKERYSGPAYVESLGSVVSFDSGNFEFLYTAQGIQLRDHDIGRSSEESTKLFSEIAQQLPSDSLVLNVGAGANTVPIESMRAAGHNVISMDGAKEVAEVLSNRTDTPVFSCDLEYLDRVMDESSVDYLIGNSVLAYMDIRKLPRAVDAMTKVMKQGAVFTFDITPHPFYFGLLKDRNEKTVINDSHVDPAELIQFIEKYGPQEGVSAMAYHQFMRGTSFQMAFLDIIQRNFERNGLRVNKGLVRRSVDEGHTPFFVLRVDKNDPDALIPLSSETGFDDTDQAFQQIADGVDKPVFRLTLIDRGQAAILAKQFGLNGDAKLAPLEVAQHVAQLQSNFALSDVAKKEIENSLRPSHTVERLQPYVDGADYDVPKPMSEAMVKDQMGHRIFFEGRMDWSVNQLVAWVDAAYKEGAIKRESKMQKRKDSSNIKAKKKAKKEERRRRKKNRN